MVADRGAATNAVTIILFVLCTLFVVARFYTRAFIVKSIKQDDWWILAAWTCALAFTIAICIGVRDGLGKHLSDIPINEQDNLRHAQYAFSILYNPCLMLTKTSIIVFYLSVLSKDVDPVFKWCNWVTLAAVNIPGLALTFLNIFQCSPVADGYKFPVPDDAKCTNIVTLYLSSAPVNIITDLALLLLPFPILTGLRLPKKQKIILVVTFGAGLFVAVVDIIRIAYLQEAALDRLSLQGSGPNQHITQSEDFPWYASLSFMWSAIEVHIGIVCACVPSLKALFLKFAPNFLGDTPNSNAYVDPEKERAMNQPLSSMNVDQMAITNPAALRKPTIREYDGEDDGDEMGFLNMLSGPGPDGESDRPRTTRLNTASSAITNFDFVQMDKNRNMLKLNNRQSVWPFAVVTVIFFVWGFAYGLLATLNGQFQKIANLSEGEGLGLHGAYYAGYFIGPLTLGHFMLSRYGFKACMMAGLCVYGCGTLIFWPSAVLTSYAAFVVSNFIVGYGLSCLENASNPYIALAGPLEYAEVRLNLSQAIQACGSVVSPLLADKVLFKNILDAPSLVDVQWTYLGIGLFVWLLAIIFYYIPLPEATASQLEEQAEQRDAVYRARIGPYTVVWWTLSLGVFSQWCYVGAQEGQGSYAGSLITLLNPRGNLDADSWTALNHTSFAMGRFIGAFFNYLLKPRWLLMACYLGIVVLCAVQMSANGTGGAVIANLIFFFEGSVFPIIFAISMRGMGAATFRAASYMTAAISAGAVIPPIQWAVRNHQGLKYSWSVLLAVFAFGAIFPIYLNLVPAARLQVDPIHEIRGKRRMRRRERTGSIISTGGHSVNNQFGLGGILARRKQQQRRKSTQNHEISPEHIENVMTKETLVVEKSRAPWDNDDLVFPEVAKTKTKDSTGSSSNAADLRPWAASKSYDFGIKNEKTESSQSVGSGVSPGSEVDGDDLEPVDTAETREWTEEDEVRLDYHEALKGL